MKLRMTCDRNRKCGVSWFQISQALKTKPAIERPVVHRPFRSYHLLRDLHLYTLDFFFFFSVCSAIPVFSDAHRPQFSRWRRFPNLTSWVYPRPQPCSIPNNISNRMMTELTGSRILQTSRITANELLHNHHALRTNLFFRPPSFLLPEVLGQTRIVSSHPPLQPKVVFRFPWSLAARPSPTSPLQHPHPHPISPQP
jgi:hypothetical protein